MYVFLGLILLVFFHFSSFNVCIFRKTRIVSIACVVKTVFKGVTLHCKEIFKTIKCVNCEIQLIVLKKL